MWQGDNFPVRMNLPNPILLHIVECLDPIALANVAQVSKEWRTLVYRPSVWRQFHWKQRRGEYFYRSEYLPTHIRHIGEPTDLCFLSWIASKIRHTHEMFMAQMPREILLLNNPHDFMTAMKHYWYTHRKPCVHTSHHKWSDVLKSRSHLSSLSHKDIMRLHFRLVEYPESDTNQYRFWLTEHLYDLTRCDIHSIERRPPPDSHDILHVLTEKVEQTNIQRRETFWKLREHTKKKYHDSIRALGRIGRLEMEANERYVEKHYRY